MSELKQSSTQRIQHLFPNLSEQDLNEILEESELLEIKTGEFLIHQGSTADAYYFVTKGRMRAIQEKDGDTIILGDIAVGEPVGEMAFFTGGTRMASVIAVRKSEALKITRASFESIVKHRPHLAATTSKFIIERLQRNELENHKRSAPKNIAVLKLNPKDDLAPWTDDMEANFLAQKLKLNVFDAGTPVNAATSAFFESLEENEGINLLVIDELDIEWSRNCCIYADLIVVASTFQASSELRPIEQQLDLYQKGLLQKKVYLLLLHDADAPSPTQTARWFEKREINLHIHVRKHHRGDIGRFCRIITHRAVGLVLGGGGAKGFAHIGVVKAMVKKGIPIDFLGGTSAGAIYGMCMSFYDFNFEEVERMGAESVKRKITSNDLNVPLTSIMSGKKLTEFIKYVFKNRDIEDIWVNSFCVSTNFSKAKIAVHERGSLWRRVRASISIPGIFPPVVIDNYLHVDGAVMDNLPIEPMYRFPVAQIYAISLSGVVERKTNFDDAPTSRQILAAKFTGKKYKMPGIASILINSLSINSLQKQSETKKKVSHFLELDLKRVGFLDSKKWRSIVDRGYSQAMAWLESHEK